MRTLDKDCRAGVFNFFGFTGLQRSLGPSILGLPEQV